MTSVQEKSEPVVPHVQDDELPAPTTATLVKHRRRLDSPLVKKVLLFVAATFAAASVLACLIVVGVKSSETDQQYRQLSEKLNHLIEKEAHHDFTSIVARNFQHEDPSPISTSTCLTLTLETTITDTVFNRPSVVPEPIETEPLTLPLTAGLPTSTITYRLTRTVSVHGDSLEPTYSQTSNYDSTDSWPAPTSTVTVTVPGSPQFETESALPVSGVPTCACGAATETVTVTLAGQPPPVYSTVELTSVLLTRSETITELLPVTTLTATLEGEDGAFATSAADGISGSISSELGAGGIKTVWETTTTFLLQDGIFPGGAAAPTAGVLPPQESSALQFSTAPFANVTTTTVTGSGTGGFRVTPTPIQSPVLSGGSSKPRAKGGNNGGSTPHYCVVMLISALLLLL